MFRIYWNAESIVGVAGIFFSWYLVGTVHDMKYLDIFDEREELANKYHDTEEKVIEEQGYLNSLDDRLQTLEIQILELEEKMIENRKKEWNLLFILPTLHEKIHKKIQEKIQKKL